MVKYQVFLNVYPVYLGKSLCVWQEKAFCRSLELIPGRAARIYINKGQHQVKVFCSFLRPSLCPIVGQPQNALSVRKPSVWETCSQGLGRVSFLSGAWMNVHRALHAQPADPKYLWQPFCRSLFVSCAEAWPMTSSSFATKNACPSLIPHCRQLYQVLLLSGAFS